MTKKMILSSLLASTMLLGAATASADEVTAIDSSTPITEVTTNPATTPSTTVTGQVRQQSLQLLQLIQQHQIHHQLQINRKVKTMLGA